MDILVAGRQPRNLTMHGDLSDLTELTTTELEQIIGQGGMDNLNEYDMMHCPQTNGAMYHHGMAHDSVGGSHMMMNGGNPMHNMALPPPHIQASPQMTAAQPAQQQPSQQQQQQQQQPTPMEAVEAWVEITEQPRQRGLRFRYQCEGRSAGSIPGENSTTENKTFPTVKIHNYRGPAIIVVSCVTKEQPPRCKPHPHSLVGKDCKKGVCTVKVKDTSVVSFPQLGIQCAKKKDVEDALKLRKDINVDPYQTGFDHVSSNIDLNMVRLCFQVFLPDSNGKVTRVVPPVVSEPIQDKKAQNDLVICRVDRTSGKARGGDEVFLLCEKVSKDDIKVRFYEEENDETLWEAFGDFGQGDVHRQFAIVFKTPRYKEEFISRPANVNMQLFRPSVGQGSDPIKFTYMPEDPDPDRIEEKRKRKGDWLNKMMPSSGSSDGGPSSSSSSVKESLRHMLHANRRIKREKAECAQAMGAQGISMNSAGSGSSVEPLSNASSSAVASQNFLTTRTATATTTTGGSTTTRQTNVAASSLQQKLPSTSTIDASQLVQQFIQQAGGNQQGSAGGQMSLASTASGGNNSQPGSLDESLLNLVTMPVSMLMSNIDMNAIQSFLEQGGSFSSGDGGSNHMMEVQVSSQEGNQATTVVGAAVAMAAGGGGVGVNNVNMSAADLAQQQMQQQADFLEVQAALESLNQA